MLKNSQKYILKTHDNIHPPQAKQPTPMSRSTDRVE
jgi:hypothetical protein